MKIAIPTASYVTDITALKAIASAGLSNGDQRVAGSNGYTYYASATDRGIKPDDLGSNPGRWIFSNSVVRTLCSIEADSYDFVANSATEITDITSVESIGLLLIDPDTVGWYDQKCVRDHLKNLIYAKMGVAVPADVEDQVKWDSLTSDEKSIAAHWFIVGKHSFQDEVVDDIANNRRYWKLKALAYRDWTLAVKDFRLKLMEAVVFCGILDTGDAKKIMEDLDQIAKSTEEFEFDTGLGIANTKAKLVNKVRFKKLRGMYKDGIQDQANDGIDGLRDFIDSTTGTVYAGNGFRNYTYTTRGSYTIGSLADELLTIIDGTW